MTDTAFRLPVGWSAAPVDDSEAAALLPGVRCTPRLRLEPGADAPGHDRLVLRVLAVTAESATGMDELAHRLVAEESAHAGDAEHRILRWVRVRSTAPEALTSAHFLIRTPGVAGRSAELVVAHVRGDMRTDETTAASVALAGAIVATFPEVQ